MNEAQLERFRAIAEAMQTEPTNWQWVGPHMSQRHFGITKTRAEAYVRMFGGEAREMDPPGPPKTYLYEVMYCVNSDDIHVDVVSSPTPMSDEEVRIRFTREFPHRTPLEVNRLA